MGEVAKGGRTVLFVSHNIGAIKMLTNRCLVLKAGCLTLNASPDEAIAEYLGAVPAAASTAVDVSYYRRSESTAGADALLRDVYASTAEAEPQGTIRAGQPISIQVVIEAKRAVAGACVSVALFNARQEHVVQLLSYDQGFRIALDKGVQTVQCTLPPLPLRTGRLLHRRRHRAGRGRSLVGRGA